MGLKLGVTGTFGSGKSTVAGLFESRGPESTVRIDADELARKAVAPGQPALAEIAEAFGEDLIDARGELRRKALAERVFDAPGLERYRAVRRLNGIVHPHVRRLELEWMDRHREAPLLILDVPLLFEAGMERLVDRVVTVTLLERQRFARLRGRGFGEREIIRRLAFQWPQALKARKADYVVDNSGTIEKTKKQVDFILNQITGDRRENHESQNT